MVLLAIILIGAGLACLGFVGYSLLKGGAFSPGRGPFRFQRRPGGRRFSGLAARFGPGFNCAGGTAARRCARGAGGRPLKLWNTSLRARLLRALAARRRLLDPARPRLVQEGRERSRQRAPRPVRAIGLDLRERAGAEFSA